MFDKLFAALEELTAAGHLIWDRTTADSPVTLQTPISLIRDSEVLVIAVNGQPQHTKSSFHLAEAANAQFIRINKTRIDAEIAAVENATAKDIENIRREHGGV